METHEERIEKILALLLIETLKGTKKDKTYKLSLCGFSNVEIADLLEIKATVVAKYLYETRKSQKQKKTS